MDILYIGQYSIHIKTLFNKIQNYNLTLFETNNNVNILSNDFIKTNKHINTIYVITKINDIYNYLFIKEKKEYDIIYIQSLKYINDILLLLSFSFLKEKSIIMIKNYEKKKDIIMNIIKIFKYKFILSFKNDTLFLKTNINYKIENYMPSILTFYQSSTNQKINFKLIQKKEKPTNILNIDFDIIKSFNYKYLNNDTNDKIFHPFYLLQINSYFAYIHNHVFQLIDNKMIIFNKIINSLVFMHIIICLQIFNIFHQITHNNDSIIILHQNFIPYESNTIYEFLELFSSIIPMKIKIIDLTTTKTDNKIFNTFQFNEKNYMKIFFNNDLLNEDIFKITHKLPKIDYITLPRNYYSSNDVLCIKKFLLSILFILKIQKQGGGFILYFKNTFDKAIYDILFICKEMYKEVYIQNTILSPYSTFLICKNFNPNSHLEQKLEQIYYQINENLFVHQLLENKINKNYLHELDIYQKNKFKYLQSYQRKIYKLKLNNKKDKIENIFHQLNIFFSFIKNIFF